MTLKELLEREYAARTNEPNLFGAPDPLQIARDRATPATALICALFAYGNAAAIVRFLRRIDFDVLGESEREIRRYVAARRLIYRFQNCDDVAEIFVVLARLRGFDFEDCVVRGGFDGGEMSARGGDANSNLAGAACGGDFGAGLGAECGAAGDGLGEDWRAVCGLNALIKTLWAQTARRTAGMEFAFGRAFDGEPKSPFKRLFMWLRWMVRGQNSPQNCGGGGDLAGDLRRKLAGSGAGDLAENFAPVAQRAALAQRAAFAAQRAAFATQRAAIATPHAALTAPNLSLNQNGGKNRAPFVPNSNLVNNAARFSQNATNAAQNLAQISAHFAPNSNLDGESGAVGVGGKKIGANNAGDFGENIAGGATIGAGGAGGKINAQNTSANAGDRIDLGLFRRISPARLIIPLDVHTHRVSLAIGLCERKSYDYKAAAQITRRLAAFDAADPVKYDFALYRIGQSGDLEKIRAELDGE